MDFNVVHHSLVFFHVVLCLKKQQKKQILRTVHLIIGTSGEYDVFSVLYVVVTNDCKRHERL